MFTGLVCERGRVVEEPQASGQGGARLRIGYSRAISSRLTVGASLAVSGVCLTVTSHAADCSTVELAPETLSRTNLGALREGDEVNLEPPLAVGDPLGGHWVQGHVDTTVAVLARRDLTDHRLLTVEVPAAMEAFVVEKGSVALDGVSLTVAGRRPGSFDVALIPHTLTVTTLGNRATGDLLNLEVDILAKYVFQSVSAIRDQLV